MSQQDGFLRDRLEIMDLIHSYAHHADSGDMGAFIELFDDHAEIDIGMPGIHDKPTLAAAMNKRPRPAPGVQTRHVMSNLVFREQAADRAGGALYFTLMSASSGTVTPLVTGVYTFAVARGAAGWRIRRWRAAMDSAPPMQ
jgi:hypothetical protein